MVITIPNTGENKECQSNHRSCLTITVRYSPLSFTTISGYNPYITPSSDIHNINESYMNCMNPEDGAPRFILKAISSTDVDQHSRHMLRLCLAVPCKSVQPSALAGSSNWPTMLACVIEQNLDRQQIHSLPLENLGLGSSKPCGLQKMMVRKIAVGDIHCTDADVFVQDTLSTLNTFNAQPGKLSCFASLSFPSQSQTHHSKCMETIE